MNFKPRGDSVRSSEWCSGASDDDMLGKVQGEGPVLLYSLHCNSTIRYQVLQPCFKYLLHTHTHTHTYTCTHASTHARTHTVIYKK